MACVKFRDEMLSLETMRTAIGSEEEPPVRCGVYDMVVRFAHGLRSSSSMEPVPYAVLNYPNKNRNREKVGFRAHVSSFPTTYMFTCKGPEVI
jgi:hypothetical protein